MTDTGIDQAVENYLASVRAELADLPPAELGEILDDIGPHVAEVAGELEGDDPAAALRERLGPPEQYAAELRAAAGYPPRAVAPPVTTRSALSPARLGLWLLAGACLVMLPAGGVLQPDAMFVLLLLAGAGAGVSLLVVTRSPGGVAAVGELPEVGWLRGRNPGGTVEEYARLFQPGWWLVRAGLAAAAIAWFAAGGTSALVILLLAVPLAVGSVWLGRRSQADRRWLWVVLPLNVFAVMLGLALLERGGPYQYGGSQVVYQDVRPYSNIYPYDSTGRPLSGVFLYDQNGQPITVEDYYGQDCLRGRVPVPANQFPRPEFDYDVNGECVVRTVTPTPSQLPSASIAPPAPSGSTAPTAPTATSAPPAGATSVAPSLSPSVPGAPAPSTTK